MKPHSTGSSVEDFELMRAQAQEVLRDAQTFFLVALGSNGNMRVVHPASPIQMLGLIDYAQHYTATIMHIAFLKQLFDKGSVDWGDGA